MSKKKQQQEDLEKRRLYQASPSAEAVGKGCGFVFGSAARALGQVTGEETKAQLDQMAYKSLHYLQKLPGYEHYVEGPMQDVASELGIVYEAADEYARLYDIFLEEYVSAFRAGARGK